MILVKYTHDSYLHEWDRLELDEIGYWVTCIDEKTEKRVVVPRERIEEIHIESVNAQPTVKNDGSYPPDWGVRKQYVLARDGYLCQNCWRLGGEFGPKDLEVHHIVPKALSIGTHRPTNLITLCEGCHEVIPVPKP